jgi:hypothetical protein
LRSRAVPRLAVAPSEGSRFQVGSETVPGKVYDVDLAAFSCSCHAGEAGYLCKHVKAALEFHQARAQHEAKEAEQMPLPGFDPWQGDAPRARRKLLKLGYRMDEVASALQKEIRRGDEEAAVYWALLLYDAVPYYAWKRVLITAAEDVGFACPDAVRLACDLAQAWHFCKQFSWYVSPHHFTMAVMALCRAGKSTEAEDLQSLTVKLQKRGHKRPVPEYALDGHTEAGRQQGATWGEWYANRHYVFGIPVNRYTERLWEVQPDWRPRA